VRCIGAIQGPGALQVLDVQGQPLATPWAGFDHFKV
jgi:hypothetical protein